MHKSNPSNPEDSWKEKARLELLEHLRQKESEKHQRKVQENVTALLKYFKK